MSTLPTSTVIGVGVSAGAVLAAGALPMARWEQRLRATGGPGIVGLQLAGDAEQARRILETWGVDGRRAATEQTWADFAWMHSYGVLGVCLGELARRGTDASSGWARSGRLVRWLPAAAVACDIFEGVGLLRTLDSRRAPEDGVVRLTRAAASTKYALLATSALWALGAATLGRRARWESLPSGR